MAVRGVYESDAQVVVIGGGIVGLASARAIQRSLGMANVHVLEKEPRIAEHQTGRNSGVVHSGIYYPPNSAKATLVRSGRALLTEFCERHAIEIDWCGKVISATTAPEVERLKALERRALDHRLQTRWLNSVQLRDREPHAEGLAALEVPETGITDYVAVCDALVAEIVEAGGSVSTGHRVTGIEEHSDHVVLEVDRAGSTSIASMRADWFVNCAGLYSDRVASLAGRDPEARIMPFRGEYFELTPRARPLVRHLIYPVPDPRFPFLGVHFTRMVNGEIHAGPNAVLALAREGYDWTTLNSGDLAEMARSGSSWRLAHRYWRTGAAEMHRSLSKDAFVRALQRLVPDIRAEHLVRSKAGVRAQAITANGALVDDFSFADGRRGVHVVNAPSPAATASLSIGEAIATRLSATGLSATAG
jgi:L-2-hydroxyglutarate oxidase